MASELTHNQRIGRWGEQAAIDSLIAKGYRVVERNVFTPYGEIDIVAELGDMLVLVEVKTRTGQTTGLPEQAITLNKHSKMERAAAHYANEHQIEAYQLDVIAIEFTPNGNHELTHFENV